MGRSMLVEQSMDSKRCSKCGETKALGEFSKNAGGKYGVRSYCRVCHAQYDAKPEYKAKKREHQAKPEYKAKKRENEAKPENKAKQRERDAKPERKAKKREYNATPKHRARCREHAARPGNRAKSASRCSSENWHYRVSAPLLTELDATQGQDHRVITAIIRAEQHRAANLRSADRVFLQRKPGQQVDHIFPVWPKHKNSHGEVYQQCGTGTHFPWNFRCVDKNPSSKFMDWDVLTAHCNEGLVRNPDGSVDWAQTEWPWLAGGYVRPVLDAETDEMEE